MAAPMLPSHDQSILHGISDLFQTLIQQAKQESATDRLLLVISTFQKNVLRLASQEFKHRQYTFKNLQIERNAFSEELIRLKGQNDALEKKAKRCQLELELCQLDVPEALINSRKEVEELRVALEKVPELEKRIKSLREEVEQLYIASQSLLEENSNLKESCVDLRDDFQRADRQIRILEDSLKEKNDKIDDLALQCDKLNEEKSAATQAKTELLRENSRYKEEMIAMRTNVMNLNATTEMLSARVRFEKSRQNEDTKLVNQAVELLYCRNCEEHFEESAPLIGSCGHTICRTCFEALSPPDCPHCGEKRAFKKGILNGLVLEMLRLLERPKGMVFSPPTRRSPIPEFKDQDESFEKVAFRSGSLGKSTAEKAKRRSILKIFRNSFRG